MQAGTGGDLSLSFGAVLHCLNTHWVTITCVYDPLSMALLWLLMKEMILYGVEELHQKISAPAENSPGPGGLLEFQI